MTSQMDKVRQKRAVVGEARKRVSEKIAFLRKEGTPEKQAVAEALNMERSGRLRRHGAYVPARRK